MVLTLHRDALRFIEKGPVVSAKDDMKLQDVYMTLSAFSLLRGRKLVSA